MLRLLGALTANIPVAQARGRGGRAGKVELMTGIGGASSRPVRTIVLRAE